MRVYHQDVTYSFTKEDIQEIKEAVVAAEVRGLKVGGWSRKKVHPSLLPLTVIEKTWACLIIRIMHLLSMGRSHLRHLSTGKCAPTSALLHLQVEEVTREDFPLPMLGLKLEAIHKDLIYGV